MKLLNRNNLAVRFAAAKEESRYTLRAILATEHETVATDGHVLVRVSVPELDANSFPAIDGFKPNGFTHGLIPVDAAKEIENAIPKKTTLPILAHAAITSEHVPDSDRTVLKIAATDLDTPKVFTVREPEGQFPNWKNVWPDVDQKPAADICFDARLLAAVATAAAKFSDHRLCAIRLRVYGSNSAMRFDLVNDDGQEMNGLLMPCRASVASKFREPAPKAEPEQTEPEQTDDAA